MAEGAIGRLANGTLSPVIERLPDEQHSRFNDVIADPRGRVVCGTMPTNERPG